MENSSSPDSSYGSRTGSAADTASYSGATRYGSGTTSGPGFGNKTGSFPPSDKHDSTVGKLMEKAGGILKSSKLEAKGLHKREEAGFAHEKKNDVAASAENDAS
ncbi:hypothetical protein IWZ00DRAFT_486750 [Phyllosticta capitalensis]|uniref:Uncharacterized protein n=1 Tax=Phyllosticta capitalensis TaxID=121624 RepID=A0ABR1YUQ4_9PEZI